MVAYRGSGRMAPLFLNLGIRWKWVVNFTPQPLWTILRRGNTLWLAEIRNLDGPARSLAAVTTAQHPYQFSHSTHSPSKEKIEVQEFIRCTVRILYETCIGNTEIRVWERRAQQIYIGIKIKHETWIAKQFIARNLNYKTTFHCFTVHFSIQ